MLPILVSTPIVRVASVNDATGNVIVIYCLGFSERHAMWCAKV